MSAAARTATASATPALRHLLPRRAPTPVPAPPHPDSSPSPSSALHRAIARMSARQGTPLTLRELYGVGQRARTAPLETRLTSARWLHNELPIRLAHRARELSALPHGLASVPSVIAVREMYEDSFSQLVSLSAPVDAAGEQQLSDVLTGMYAKHGDVTRLIAKGVIELKELSLRHRDIHSNLEIRSFLDTFYMSRIGIRVLINHHLSLGGTDKDMAGIINTRCRPVQRIRELASIAQNLSYQHYGDAAPVEVHGNDDLTFPYVDSHLNLCLMELLKNSLRATIETHKDAAALPPVKVIVADGAEDVAVKISDQGGGFKRSELRKVWSYLFTTAKLPPEVLIRREDDRMSASVNRPDPIAGFGCGLPLSRLYARYWGGELALTSMEGYGTDAYLHLSKLGDKKECLSA